MRYFLIYQMRIKPLHSWTVPWVRRGGMGANNCRAKIQIDHCPSCPSKSWLKRAAGASIIDNILWCITFKWVIFWKISRMCKRSLTTCIAVTFLIACIAAHVLIRQEVYGRQWWVGLMSPPYLLKTTSNLQYFELLSIRFQRRNAKGCQCPAFCTNVN